MSESLRRAPGVVFERDQQTGDGTNIAIRGLAPDLNTVKFNGIELPESSGVGRSASLSNILTESISKVTISKTLLPNQDSSGTGGLVEIETKTPLDRPKRYLSATLEGAQRDDDFNQELLAAGTASMRFGSNDQFGVSASVQYRERDIKRVGYRADLLFGQFLPLQVDGTPTIGSSVGIDPRSMFPFEEEASGVYPLNYFINRDRTKTKNLGITLSAAAELGNHTKLFVDYQKLRQNDTSYVLSWGFSPFVQYTLMPVAALGGEQRRALAWFDRFVEIRPRSEFRPDNKSNTDIYTFRGETDVGKLSLRYSGGYTKGRSSRPSYVMNTLSGAVFDPSMILPGAIDPVEGRYISPFAPISPGDDSFFTPLITSAGYDFLNNPANFNVSGITYSEVNGSNNRYNLQGSARYDFSNSVLRYLEVGGSYEGSKFKDRNDVFENYRRAAGQVKLPAIGIDFSGESLDDVGIDSNILLPDMAALRDFYLNRLSSFSATCAPFGVPPVPCPPGILFTRTLAGNELLGGEFTDEKETALWVQGQLQFGKLEIVGGARLSHVKIDANSLVGPIVIDENFIQDVAFRTANTKLVSDRASQTEILPRLLANYRFNDNLVVRGGYYLAVARPQISLLSQTPLVQLLLPRAFGPNGNQPLLTVTKGNPDLKPARTHNFDVSLEYYDNNVGVIKIGAFYKRINNLLESNAASGIGALEDSLALLPDDPRFQDVVQNPEGYFISVGTPVNNADPAHIWGIETSLERQFTFLPGALSGLGIYANYTFTDSSKNQPLLWNNKPVQDGTGAVVGFETATVVIPDVRFNGQARHSGTIGLTYNKYGIDANIAYTAQARRQTSYQAFNLSAYEEAYSSLDARLEYKFKFGGGDFSVYFEGTDLLKGPHDPGIRTTQGADDGVTPKYFNSARYFGGRQLRAGVRASF